jgi:hypothetical protein
MQRFHQYVERRLREDAGLDINSLRAMILDALHANAESQDAYNSPLVQFAQPGELMDRLNSLKGLQQLIQSNDAAQKAIMNAQQTNLTVGELAGILSASQPETGNE